MEYKKLSLGFSPTPIHELTNLSKLFEGYRLFIKRDDNNGLGTGGNKIRKLEYLLQDARDKGADTVITAGAQQSNHCRLTAAACAKVGLKCHLLLGGEKPNVYNGNLLLSHLFGAKIRFTGNNRKGEDIPETVEELKNKGNKPYMVPYGGSNEIGALGYTNAVLEIKNQVEEMDVSIDYIIFASSSGGTQAGLIAGCEIYQLGSKVLGISIDKEETNVQMLDDIINKLVLDVLKLHHYEKSNKACDINLIRDYDKAGYGVITENEKKAIKLLAATEGILLDPVYTGRAFYGMMNLMETKRLKQGSNILFLHTGGIPANFYYAKDMVP